MASSNLTFYFTGGKKVGINPKINNLMPGYEVAKYDLVWICDSGIRVKPDTLTDMANQMTEKVGLVHGLPYVADRQGFAATLEQRFPTGLRRTEAHWTSSDPTIKPFHPYTLELEIEDVNELPASGGQKPALQMYSILELTRPVVHSSVTM
ncbi:UNVERIFIED_CONTAM: hypothetical protein FKN15_073957 [Acipenser sinensis]